MAQRRGSRPATPRTVGLPHPGRLHCTVSDAVPVMEPEVAVMVTAPVPAPGMMPPVLMVAKVVLEELQITVEASR